MDSTPNLQLPYLAAAQAQKHVTHNEALRALDALVQLSVLDKDLASPPGSPADGSRYIVAAGPTGAWAGQAAKIAAWQDGAWMFYAPGEGWLAWVADEDKLYAWSGMAWAEFTSPGTGVPLWGINATADTTNRLAVRSPASLLDNVGAGHQQKINKAAAGDTASQLFQTNYSGRAEFGLTGDDDFHVKVSPDGSAWHEAMIVNHASGRANFVCGIEIAGGAAFDIGTPAFRAVSSVANELGFSLKNTNTAGRDWQIISTGGAGGLGNGNLVLYDATTGGGTGARLVITPAGDVGFGTAAPSNKLSAEGIAAPETDNAYTLGTSGKRWSEVYAATGTINTSDERLKTDVEDSPLGLAFVLALKPRAYRWLEGGTIVEWDEECYEVEGPVTEARTVADIVVEVVDGQAVARQVESTIQVPVFDHLPVVDADDRPVMVRNPQDPEKGEPVQKVLARPRMRTVTGTRQVKREVKRRGERTHFGLVAQEVKAALEQAGAGDFAGWVLGDKDDPHSQQGLRYDQLIAPLIKAVQELAARVASLEAQQGS